MTGLIILAAGESKRLGTPKQNLLFEGETLLNRAIKAATQSNCKPVILVLGANFDAIFPLVNPQGIKIIRNENWASGMASGIREGVTELIHNNGTDSVVLTLCDQPFVDSALINNIVELYKRTKKPIVACSYKQTLGVPVLFDAKYFNDLLNLQGSDGAKQLLQKYCSDVAQIPFPKGNIDIDTFTDYEKLSRRD